MSPRTLAALIAATLMVIGVIALMIYGICSHFG